MQSERLTIKEVIDYIHSLCSIRETSEEKAEDIKIIFNEMEINQNLITSLFSALLPKINTLSIQDKIFYIQKYIEYFIIELKKKNIYFRYTTETNIIDKKIIAKTLKTNNIDEIEKENYENFLIFVCMFFNINIFIFNDEKNIKFYTINQYFNIYKYSIVLRKLENGKYNIVKFNNQTLFNYYRNQEFKDFINNNRDNIFSLKQNMNFKYDNCEFEIKDDNDIKHYEESTDSISEINKGKQFKNNIKNIKQEEHQESQQDNQPDETIFKNDNLKSLTTTERIKEVIDFQYSEEELKKMTLPKIKEITRECKLRLTNPETKRAYTKAELIKKLIEYSNY